MADQKLQFILSAKDYATKEFSKMSSSFQKMVFDMEKATSASRYFAVGLAGIGTGILAVGGFALKAADDLEQMEIAFETMLGSEEKAKQLTTDLINFAKKTPFELSGLQQTTKQLLAYGFAQDEIIPTLTALGNISAGVGMDKLPNLTLAFGQVKAATRLTGMELRQFSEAGVPLLDELAKQFGKTAGEIQDMISRGEVGFPAVEQALKSLSGEGGRFNNLMAKQATTFSGLVSNLRDAWNIFLQGEGKVLLDWAKEVTIAMIGFVENVLPQLILKIQEVGSFFAQNQEAIYTLAGAILGGLTPAILSAVASFGALAIAIAPWIIGGALIGGAIYAMIEWAGGWENVKNTILGWWAVVQPKLIEAYDWIKVKLTEAMQYLSDFWGRHGDKIISIFQNIYAISKAQIDGIIFVFQKLKEGVEIIMGKLGISWGDVWRYILFAGKASMDNIKAVISFGFNFIVNALTVWRNIMQGNWAGAWEGIKILTANAWEGIKNIFKNYLNSILSIFGTSLNEVQKKITELVDKAYQWGGNLLTEFGDGISAAAYYPIQKAQDLANGIADYIGFSSPSKKGAGKDADKWAPNLMFMFADGIEKGGQDVIEELADMMEEMSGVVKDYTDDNFVIQQKYIESVKNHKENIKELTEEYKKNSDSIKLEIDGIKSKIEDLNSVSVDIETSFGGGVAESILKQKKVIEDLKKQSEGKEGDELTAIQDRLKKEQEAFDQYANYREQYATQIAELEAFQSKTDFEQNILNLEKEKEEKLKQLEETRAQLEDELKLKTDQYAEEQARFALHIEALETQRQKDFENYNNYLQLREAALERSVARMRETEGLSSFAQSSGIGDIVSGDSTGNTSTQQTINVPINLGGVNINNQSDLNTFKSSITDAVSEALRLSNLGVPQ